MTTREVILKCAEDCDIEAREAESIIGKLAFMGYVCVPIEPTKFMIQNAWADALSEDAAGVWACMIQACEDPVAALETLK